jgi:hypothetical protein
MIHATDTWVFILLILILGVFIECGNRSDIGMGACTLSSFEELHT